MLSVQGRSAGARRGATVALRRRLRQRDKTTTTTAPLGAAGSRAAASMAGMNMGAARDARRSRSTGSSRCRPRRSRRRLAGNEDRRPGDDRRPVRDLQRNQRADGQAGAKTSFHLMVMLNDAHTGVAIPYATRVGDDQQGRARSSTTSGSGR